MKHVSSKWVPHFPQAEENGPLSFSMFRKTDTVSQDPDFQYRVIIVDESWIHYYNPKTKGEAEAWFDSGEFGIKKVC